MCCAPDTRDRDRKPAQPIDDRAEAFAVRKSSSLWERRPEVAPRGEQAMTGRGRHA
jgi:hypothetical protein